MQEINVTLKGGEVVLRKPTAGARNRALIKAETPEGLKNSLMMVELLPVCIKSHPWSMVPVRDALDNLEIEEYDLLIDKLRVLLSPSEEVKKKLIEQ